MEEENHCFPSSLLYLSQRGKKKVLIEDWDIMHYKQSQLSKPSDKKMQANIKRHEKDNFLLSCSYNNKDDILRSI